MSDPIAHYEAVNQKTEGAAMLARAAVQFLNWLSTDVRTRDDSLRITDEAERVAKQYGGVLIVREIAHTVDPTSGGDFQEYLGIRVGAGGKTEAEARAAYNQALRHQAKPVDKPSQCTIDNTTGLPVRERPTMSASNKDQAYVSYTSKVLARKASILHSNSAMEVSLSTDYLFFTWNDWCNYVAFMRRSRRG